MKRALVVLVLLLAVPGLNSAGPIEQARKAIEVGNYEKALSKLEPLAERGDPAAQRLLGLMLYLGYGVDQDFEKAVEWIRKASDAGLAEAHISLGHLYEEGDGVVRDRAKATSLYRAAAEQDDEIGFFYLGTRYARGLGVERDPAAAAEWFTKAAKRDDADAMYELGYAYLWGHGVELDATEAGHWFRKAANMEHEASQNRGLPWPTPRGDPRSKLEPDPCWFEVREGQMALCGRMFVPENRQRRESSLISFPVVVYRTRWDLPEAFPVVILARGGPGGSAYIGRDDADEHWDTYDWQFLDEGRDVIVVDQRGAGLSEPSLACPEMLEIEGKLLTRLPSIEEEVSAGVDAAKRCRDRLASEGIDLSSYDSATSAADIEDLRLALGYKQWDLYGASYSGRWALTLARDFPDGVRSMILDSPAAHDTRLADDFGAVHDAFAEIFVACDADPACGRRFPNARDALVALFESLETEPVDLMVTHPKTLQPFKLSVDGDRLIEMLFWGMYGEWMIEQMPLALAAAGNGSYDLLTSYGRHMLREYADEDWSAGLHMSVQCRESGPFDDYEAARLVAERDPLLAGFLSRWLEWERNTCLAWSPGVALPVESEPVTSEIPTLILSGRHDPVTRVPEARRILSHLPNAFLIEFPGMAHGIMESDFCALQVIAEFLEDPGKDPSRISCVQDLESLEFEDEP